MVSRSGPRRKLGIVRTLVHESDWLASRPYFYNTVTGRSSESINDVVEDQDPLIDPEGLYIYLDFGYAALGKTALANVRIVPPASRLWREDTGQLIIEQLEDPVEQWTNFRPSESEIIELIRSRVRRWEASTDGDILVPLSGGYDSRLLLWCLSDRERVLACSYGISKHQHRSNEVVLAQAIAERLHVRWRHVSLGHFHDYLEDWYDLFGISTHAHGMYHLEFYSKLRAMYSWGRWPLLSGILGDAWAGSVPLLPIRSPRDVPQLGYAHGIRGNVDALKIKKFPPMYNSYFSKHQKQLEDPRFQVVEIARFKIILLSYLLRVPEALGLKPWSPFLDIDIAMAMINLPPSRRSGRIWQRDFFAREGLDVDALEARAAQRNVLDREALRRVPLPPLNADLLKALVLPHYVHWINRNITVTRRRQMAHELLGTRALGHILRRVGLVDRTNEVYSAYMCLWPIEKLLADRSKINIAGRRDAC